MFNLTPTICNVKLSVTDSGDEGTMSRIAHMLQHSMFQLFYQLFGHVCAIRRDAQSSLCSHKRFAWFVSATTRNPAIRLIWV